MFKKGNRLFSVSNLTLLLVAALHTYGSFREPMGDEEIRVLETMKGYSFEAMGMNWSIHDVLVCLALTMTIFLVFVAVMNFFLLYWISSRGLLRKLILANSLLMWTLALLYFVFQIPPPFLCFVLLGILFTLSYIRFSSNAEENGDKF